MELDDLKTCFQHCRLQPIDPGRQTLFQVPLPQWACLEPRRWFRLGFHRPCRSPTPWLAAPQRLEPEPGKPQAKQKDGTSLERQRERLELGPAAPGASERSSSHSGRLSRFLQRSRRALRINAAQFSIYCRTKAWGCCFICLCLHDSSIIGAKINSTRWAAHRQSQKFPGRGFGLTLAAAAHGDKALSDHLIRPGASKGIVFFSPRGLFLPLPENWVWRTGLESRQITDEKRTLASSPVLLDDLMDKASEVQTGQLACLPQGTGFLGPDPLAISPIQTADHVLLMRWVVLVL